MFISIKKVILEMEKKIKLKRNWFFKLKKYLLTLSSFLFGFLLNEFFLHGGTNTVIITGKLDLVTVSDMNNISLKAYSDNNLKFLQLFTKYSLNNQSGYFHIELFCPDFDCGLVNVSILEKANVVFEESIIVHQQVLEIKSLSK